LSQALTLFTTPVVYLLMDKGRLRLLGFFFPEKHNNQQLAKAADAAS